MKRIYISFALAAVCFAAGAVTVDCTPGQLKTLVEKPADVTTLKINGSVDASDLFFISTEMRSLTELDMGATTIAAYNGDAVNNISSYKANSIPAGVFAGAPFVSVTLPASEGLAIEEVAFAGSALQNISVPANVTSIGQGAFSACNALRQVTMAVPTGDYMFASCGALEKVELGDAVSVGVAAFKDCTALSAVTGAANVSNIGARAFEGDTSLKGFYMGPTLEYIGARAFAGSGVETAPLAKATNLRSVGDWAFADCKELCSASLPAVVRTVGDGCFAHCPKLSWVDYQSEQIPDFVFKGTAISGEFNIPAGVTSIGAYALAGVGGVENLILPSSVNYIGDGAMEMMKGLKILDVQTFTEVPELGADVWQGVYQPAVTLKIPHDLKEQFENADQWQNFSLWPVNSLTYEITADERQLFGAFDGMTLRLRAVGADIDVVEIYNEAGMLLYRGDVNADAADIDTSAMDGNIFIVRCFLGDTASALKMLRK